LTRGDKKKSRAGQSNIKENIAQTLFPASRKKNWAEWAREIGKGKETGKRWKAKKGKNKTNLRSLTELGLARGETKRRTTVKGSLSAIGGDGNALYRS